MCDLDCFVTADLYPRMIAPIVSDGDLKLVFEEVIFLDESINSIVGANSIRPDCKILLRL